MYTLWLADPGYDYFREAVLLFNSHNMQGSRTVMYSNQYEDIKSGGTKTHEPGVFETIGRNIVGFFNSDAQFLGTFTRVLHCTLNIAGDDFVGKNGLSTIITTTKIDTSENRTVTYIHDYNPIPTLNAIVALAGTVFWFVVSPGSFLITSLVNQIAGEAGLVDQTSMFEKMVNAF